jgi:hypothetical protein
MYHESYKVHAVFFFRFCDVAKVMIIYKLIYPNLTIKNMKI